MHYYVYGSVDTCLLIAVRLTGSLNVEVDITDLNQTVLHAVRGDLEDLVSSSTSFDHEPFVVHKREQDKSLPKVASHCNESFFSI